MNKCVHLARLDVQQSILVDLVHSHESRPNNATSPALDNDGAIFVLTMQSFLISVGVIYRLVYYVPGRVVVVCVHHGRMNCFYARFIGV
jgi:hypothetical protein